MSKSLFYRILEATTFLANQAWHYLIIKLATELTIITKKSLHFHALLGTYGNFFAYFLLLFSRTKNKKTKFSSSKKKYFKHLQFNDKLKLSDCEIVY